MSDIMNESRRPLISVIIPVYNPGKHFLKCLDSIVNQTYQNLEIILIDDGSTDGSELVCDEFANKDNRVICIHQQNNGVSKARNQGLRIAKGDYIHFPDSDDYLDLDTYEYLIKRMIEQRCDAVNFEHFITYPDREVEHSFSPERYGLFDAEGAHKQFMNGVQFCCNKLFSRKLIMGQSDGERLFFREDIYRGEDTLLAAYAIERADRVYFDPRPMYHYVQSEESACRGRFRKTQLSITKLYDAYEPLYRIKYPHIWTDFLLFMQETLIGIYYDMWADESDLKDERKMLNKVWREKYKQIKKQKMSKKRKIKFSLFAISPSLFCFLHKHIHKL